MIKALCRHKEVYEKTLNSFFSIFFFHFNNGTISLILRMTIKKRRKGNLFRVLNETTTEKIEEKKDDEKK
jgi:hypothetical protein